MSNYQSNTGAFRRMYLTQCQIITAADAVAAIHHLTGYFPVSGTVYVAPLRDRRPAVGLLIMHHGRVRRFATDFTELIHGANVDGAVVIGIGPPEQLADVVHWYADQITGLGVPVHHALCATDERLWEVTYEGHAGGELDDTAPAGTSYADALPYELSETGLDECARRLGSRPFSGIDELARVLEPVTGETARQVQVAEGAARQIVDMLSHSQQWHEKLSVVVLGKLLIQLRDTRAAGRPLTVEQVALLCAMCDERPSIELAMALSRHTDLDPVLGMWSDFTRLAPPQYRSHAAALLAYAALAANDLPLAELALGIAENGDPQSPVIVVVRGLLDAGETPELSADSVADAVDDLLEPAVARFSLRDVLTLAEATLACSALEDLDGLLEPSTPYLIWTHGHLTSNGDGIEPRLLTPVETRDPRGRIPAMTVPIPVTDEVVTMLRDASEKGARQLEFRFSGQRVVAIDPIVAAASQN